MTLTAHVYCGYASYDGGHEWGQSEYDAFKLIHILKGEPIKGYVTLRKPDGQWTRMTTENPAGGFEIWRQWASAKAAEVAPGGAMLVPVPSSSCTGFGGDAKGMRLATEASNPAAGYHPLECLHWHEQFEKASKGGPRDVATLFPNVRVRDDLEPQRIILVDDVVTGGGHLIACARALRAVGHTVEHAICAGRTVKTPPAAGLWTIAPWDLEADPFEDWNCF